MISRIKSSSALQDRRRFRARHVLLGVAVAALAHSTATLAQNEDKVKAGLTAWRTSGCADCHGPFADGDQDDDDYPRGANLRITKLDAAAVKDRLIAEGFELEKMSPDALTAFVRDGLAKWGPLAKRLMSADAGR